MFDSTRRTFFGHALGSLATIRLAGNAETTTARVVRLAAEYDRTATAADQADEDDQDEADRLWDAHYAVARKLISALDAQPTNDMSGADGRAVIVGRKLYCIGPDHGNGTDRLGVFALGAVPTYR